MSQYAYDKVFINPSWDDLHSAICEAEGKANPPRARTRLVSRAGIDSFVARLDSSFHTAHEGANWWDGGGVCNSYRQLAETGVLGIAWWTDRAGNKHVRVVGDRVAAPKSAYGSKGPKKFWLTDTQYDAVQCVVLVYPDLLVPHLPKKDRGMVPELLRALETDPLDRLSWMALHDYLIETGALCFEGRYQTGYGFVEVPRVLAILDSIGQVVVA